MATADGHSRIIATAARQHLRPLGLTQKGRSRIWIGDEGWWLTIVAFQPGRTKGTYLNVSAAWLWHVRDRFACDVLEPTPGFVPYDDDASFAPVVGELAALAADRVAKLRGEFASLEGVVTNKRAVQAPQRWLDAGIALGLLHRPKEARTSLDRYLKATDDDADAIAIRTRVVKLRALLDTPEAFDSSVEHSIRDCRAGLRLDPSAPLNLR